MHVFVRKTVCVLEREKCAECVCEYCYVCEIVYVV